MLFNVDNCKNIADRDRNSKWFIYFIWNERLTYRSKRNFGKMVTNYLQFGKHCRVTHGSDRPACRVGSG